MRERQYEYEVQADAEAQAVKLQKLSQESREGAVELPRASALISSLFDEVKAHLEAIAAIKTRGTGGKYKSWLRALPSDVAAVISMRECIKLCSSSTHERHIHAQDLCIAVGKLFELEVRIRQAEQVNMPYMQKIHDQVKENCTTNPAHLRKLYNVAINRVFKGELEFALTKTDMLQIGKFGVDACVHAGLVQYERGTNRNGTTVAYSIPDEIYQYLIGYDENDVKNITNKEESRMLCAPDPWSALHDGGYLSPRRKSLAPLMQIRGIRRSERRRVAEEFTAEKMPIIFEAANYMQSIPYNIHAPTRDAIKRVWDSGGGVLGVPRKNPPVRPVMPLGEDWIKEGAPEHELALFVNCKLYVVGSYRTLREWRSRVREIGGFFRTSKNDSDPVWFPMYCDRRGRWYYRGSPNPQGSDLAKAVLHFHKKKRLGKEGLFWLKVSIANAFGYDKERFALRAAWTENNWVNIQRALAAPEDHPEVFGDSPWCVFTAAWELNEALKTGHPEDYETGVPVHMDATCSGLQHFCAMLRDPVGGQFVNLFDADGAGPKQDIYANVSIRAMQAIEADCASTDVEVATMASWWVGIGIPRSMAKKPCMTFVYGATLRGTADFIADYVMVEMQTKFPAEELVGKYSMYAAKKLFQGIASTVPAAAAAMHWLKDVASQQPNGRRMEWRTPTGFLVQHDYQSTEDYRIGVYSCGVTVLKVREFTDGTSAHAMRNAIAPNFVHSMDASHLTFTSRRMQNAGLDIVAIHDSFGTHPSDVGEMHTHIREAFVKLYEGRNVLAEFLWEVRGIGEPPMRGALDLKGVLNSEFFFC